MCSSPHTKYRAGLEEVSASKDHVLVGIPLSGIQNDVLGSAVRYLGRLSGPQRQKMPINSYKI